MSEGLRWPQGLDAAGFLGRDWQRRPRLLRGAFDPKTFALPDVDTLAGLCLEAHIESRLVQHRRHRAWTLARGPFSAAQLSALPARDWTLLIQDTDSLLEPAARLFELVDFLPRWRREDVMISIAAPGGTVGPHVDEYDVFLAQIQGVRAWRIGSRRHDPTLLRCAPLPVLRHFQARQRWQLAPGDVLYLPPGIPHFGIAGEADAPCITASLGFRAPDAGELAAVMLDERLAGAALPRYADAGLSPADARDGELDVHVLSRLQRMLAELPDEQRALGRAMGRLVTEVKPWLQPQRRRAAPNALAIAQGLAGGRALVLNPASRAAWLRRGPRTELFVNGERFELPRGCRPLAAALAGTGRSVTAAVVPRSAAQEVVHPLLAELFRRGWLEWLES